MNAREFLELVFGDAEGFLFISTKSDVASSDIDLHKAFEYPAQMNSVEKYIAMRDDEDLYFSPMLYSVPRRKAAMVSAVPVVWADTDTFDPAGYRVAPTFNINSSPGRTASLWKLDEHTYRPEEVESAARAIALTHASVTDGKQSGTDAGGWDLSQLLRLPPSKNLKYLVLKNGEQQYPEYTEPYDVTLGEVSGEIYSLSDITDKYDISDLPERQITLDMPMPQNLPEPKDVLRRVTSSRKLSELYSKEPRVDQDWSDTLYLFVSECLRAGFSAGEVLVAAWHAACNKYKRDGRPIEDLWQYDVIHALNDPKNKSRVAFTNRDADEVVPDVPRPKDEGLHKKLELALITEEERANLTKTFVDDYVEWAVVKTDAPEAYHVASALSLLSCVLGEWGIGNPQFGELRLGLFFVIMGETTDTRKSTSRNLFKSLLRMVQNRTGGDYILTSDATGEALLDTLAERPHQSSLYDRDEAQQLIEDIKGGKGYLKGFFETLNEFYDGWAHGRLRMGKKTDDTPINFVQYLMGIRTQIQDNLERKDFVSGWGPRNIWVRGDSPPRTRENSRLQQGTGVKRNSDPIAIELAEKVGAAHDFWADTKGNSKEEPMVVYFEDDAWVRATDLEWDLKEYFIDHPRYDILKPSIERLTINAMKVAILFAMYAKRRKVNLGDVINARYYAAQWVEDLVIVIEGVNESMEQRNIDRIADQIIKAGGIMTKAKLLRWSTREGLKKRDFLEYLDTLIETDVCRLVEDKHGRISLEIL